MDYLLPAWKETPVSEPAAAFAAVGPGLAGSVVVVAAAPAAVVAVAPAVTVVAVVATVVVAAAAAAAEAMFDPIVLSWALQHLKYQAIVPAMLGCSQGVAGRGVSCAHLSLRSGAPDDSRTLLRDVAGLLRRGLRGCLRRRHHRFGPVPGPRSGDLERDPHFLHPPSAFPDRTPRSHGFRNATLPHHRRIAKTSLASCGEWATSIPEEGSGRREMEGGRRGFDRGGEVTLVALPAPVSSSFSTPPAWCLLCSIYRTAAPTESASLAPPAVRVPVEKYSLTSSMEKPMLGLRSLVREPRSGGGSNSSSGPSDSFSGSSYAPDQTRILIRVPAGLESTLPPLVALPFRIVNELFIFFIATYWQIKELKSQRMTIEDEGPDRKMSHLLWAEAQGHCRPK
ncbi:hypothetical protein Taro_037793 [Colocasia esculenta]|uniref:Uncharacterized protein n=1 Tax=Colocasia esculenta TaxID=4460 RepID=A0A843WHB0_COLES|nr:hypothetical protein [Colocasia esculenta]